MEEEISLQEVLMTVWNGRRLIVGLTLAAALIAVLYSLFFTAPQYRARVFVDIDLVDTSRWQEEIPGRVDHPTSYTAYARTFDLDNNTPPLSFEAVNASPQSAQDAAEREALHFVTSYVEWQKLFIVKEIRRLVSLEDKYAGELERQAGGTAYTEQTASFYSEIAARMGSTRAARLEKELLLSELDSRLANYTEQIIIADGSSQVPVNNPWSLNAAVAAVLGFMLSVFIVFATPWVKEFKNSLQNHQAEKQPN